MDRRSFVALAVSAVAAGVLGAPEGAAPAMVDPETLDPWEKAGLTLDDMVNRGVVEEPRWTAAPVEPGPPLTYERIRALRYAIEHPRSQ